jgi:hypothetical protein
MGGVPDGGDPRRSLELVQVGDLYSGTVTAVTRSGELEIALDGFPGPSSGVVGPLDRGWPRLAGGEVEAGSRITAGVIAVDADRGRVRLPVAAARNRELWVFLSGLRHGEVLTGSVAAIEQFGVFVALDDGPAIRCFLAWASSRWRNCPGISGSWQGRSWQLPEMPSGPVTRSRLPSPASTGNGVSSPSPSGRSQLSRTNRRRWKFSSRAAAPRTSRAARGSAVKPLSRFNFT